MFPVVHVRLEAMKDEIQLTLKVFERAGGAAARHDLLQF
jgi:hypothetical protein